MKKTFIVDGNSLLFRSYYSTAYTGNLMTTKDGIPTNAIYAFHTLIKKIKERLDKGDHLYVAFDTGKTTKRKEEFEEYKAQRKKIDDALIAQLPIAREMLDAMNVFHNEIEGYEGDDLCGSMVKYAILQGDTVTVFTSDKDFLQLCALSKNITIEFLIKGLSEVKCYNDDNMIELFGLSSNQITDYKGIAGDSSDNYKGIPGVGDKTTKKLLLEHVSLENIISYFKEHNDSKLATKIIENEKEALFFKKLAQIDTSLDMEEDYKNSEYKFYEEKKLRDFYLKYELNTHLKAIDKLKDIKKNEEQMSLFEEKEELQVKKIKCFKEIEDKDISMVISSTSNNENTASIKSFYFSNKTMTYILNYEDAIKDDSFKEYLKSDIEKQIYDYKGIAVLLKRYDFPEIKNATFDFLIATYLLNPDIGQEKENIFFSHQIDINNYEDENACVSHYVYDKKDEIISRLKKDNLYKLFIEVEIPLSYVLAQMEIEGFPIDLDILKQIDDEYSTYLKKVEDEIYKLAGEQFNIASPKQVESILFDKMQLPRKKNEKGTSVEVLKSHISDHPIFTLLILYRTYNKLVTGYTKALPKHVSQDGKIHAIYNQALTTTGRLSMSEPNLQNISIRNEEGKTIRKAFYYKEDNIKMLSLDYSQIELRILAEVADIKLLKELFIQGNDIHQATASKVFGVPLDEVTSDMRRKAKAVNFGIVYGISAFGLSEQLKIHPGEAKELIEQFKTTFTGLEQFQQNTINFARENGYVKTILGRRRYLKDINSKNYMLRSFSERAATNAVIQGSAADLIKYSMIKCQKFLENYKSKIILQIHDELLFKIYDDEKDVLVDKLKEIMEHALDLSVPLKVDGEIKKTWYEVH